MRRRCDPKEISARGKLRHLTTRERGREPRTRGNQRGNKNDLGGGLYTDGGKEHAPPFDFVLEGGKEKCAAGVEKDL